MGQPLGECQDPSKLSTQGPWPCYRGERQAQGKVEGGWSVAAEPQISFSTSLFFPGDERTYSGL